MKNCLGHHPGQCPHIIILAITKLMYCAEDSCAGGGLSRGRKRYCTITPRTGETKRFRGSAEFDSNSGWGIYYTGKVSAVGRFEQGLSASQVVLLPPCLF